MGSHDIALDVVVGALAERGFSARTIAVGSLGGVAAAERGECDLAPVHLIDPATGVYNAHLRRARACAGEGLAAHAGRSCSAPATRASRARAPPTAVKAALADPHMPDGQPQCRRRHPRADRQAARRRAAARLRQPAAIAQRGRRRGRAGPRRLGRRDRAGGAALWPRRSCRSRPRTTISCWSRAGATGRRCRRFWRRCATSACAERIRALGMRPADA